MRSPILVSLVLVLAAACGDIIPIEVDATPTCDPACDQNATCGGTSCTCNTGWEGDGITCTDVNECATNNGGCDPNAACFNQPGDRNCGCNSGFVGDGLTCRRVWMLRGSTTLRLSNIVTGQTNFASAVAVGNRIFFAPEIGPPDDANHFMRSFDVISMTFAGPHSLPPTNRRDFCACGLGEVFVSDGSDIYMFGNWGYRYRRAMDVWEEIPSYTQAVSRGESAGAFENTNDIVYMIGGRSQLNNAITFTVNGASFNTEPGVLPFGLDNARAWAPDGGNVVYTAGGNATDNNRQHLVRHTTGTSTWTTLPDAPASLDYPTGMGDWQGKIWVTSRSQMFFFDLATNMWRPPLSLPNGFVTAVTVGARTFAFVQAGETLQVQELMAIE
jgi:hypothetical protein